MTGTSLARGLWRGSLMAGLAIVVVMALLAGGDAQAAKAAKKAKAGGTTSGYDGLWSVLIITEQGTCDRGYRYSVRIRNGVVGHADPGNSSFRIGGRVTGGGGISVSVARGTQSAAGNGRIARNSGSGRWRSAKGECSGVWQAERRGS